MAKGKKAKIKAGLDLNGPQRPKKKPKRPPIGADRRPMDKDRLGIARAIDAVELLHRRGHINDRQRQAADRYRTAFLHCACGIGSCLDDSRARATTGPAAPPHTQLEAARLIRNAAAILGRIDSRLVALIVGEGQSINLAAHALFGLDGRERASERMTMHAGHRLRLALDELARHWYGRPQQQGDRMRGELYVPPWDTRPDNAPVERARVVHATRRNTYEI